MRTRTVVSAVGASALAVAALSACGDGADTSGTSSKDDESSTSDVNAGKDAELAVIAMDTAAAAVKDGAIIDLELDDGQRWDVTVASGTKAQHELHISADGSKVESNNKDDDLDDDIAKLTGAKLTAQDAAQHVVEDHPGDVTSLEIDTMPNGTLTWQITLNDNGSFTEYRLHAGSGETETSEPADD